MRDIIELLSLQVNTNGILSMGSPFTEYSSRLFPISGEYLVAPLWADVNIAVGVGSIQYEVYSRGDSMLETVKLTCLSSKRKVLTLLAAGCSWLSGMVCQDMEAQLKRQV